MAETCQHEKFVSRVTVVRLRDGEGAAVSGYVAEITIICTTCHLPFQFLGLTPGGDTQGATVSLDGLEARLALCPQGERPNPMQRITYKIGAFDA